MRVVQEIIIIAVACAAITTVLATGNPCIPRNFGFSSIVCECNATYCDTFPEFDANGPSNGTFEWYATSKAGKRFELTTGNYESSKGWRSKSLTVDRDQIYQTIQGFGGALTDATSINLKSLSPETADNVIKSYFASYGSGYNFIRVPIAGTDFSTRAYTYDDSDKPDPLLTKWNLTEEDDYKIGYLHDIKRAMENPEALRVFATAWSAPAWMKTSNDIVGGSLKSEYYQTYANYIKKFLDTYKERGVDIWGLTPGNEPLDGIIPLVTFNKMGWTPGNEAKWIAENLGPTLKNSSHNETIIMAMDDQRLLLPAYPLLMFQNKEARQYVSGIAVHWYADQVVPPLVLDLTHHHFPDLFLLATEACTGSQLWDTQKVELGSWERGEDYIHSVIQDLNHWVTGWVDWNIALDLNGGPNWVSNFVDSPIIVNSTSDVFYKQPMYYALAHVSRFVPRGSQRIAVSNIYNIMTTAVLTPSKKVVVILHNRGNNNVQISIKDKFISGVINVKLAPKSINTIVYK